MLNSIDVATWTPFKVKDWLSGICDDSSWLNLDNVINNNIRGKDLLMMTPQDLEKLGCSKVSQQEHIQEAIETLRFFTYNLTTETLQASILRLACHARSLQKQIALESQQSPSSASHGTKNVVFLTDLNQVTQNQRVSLDTLAGVSSIAKSVQSIIEVLNRKPFSKYDYYRSMKSLLLALSIELTSTAQRDQFVEKPNDIIEKSSKTLADYCDRIVHGTRDPLLIQPSYLETVRIRKNSHENDLGLLIASSATGDKHLIEKISPLSLAKKTNQLNEGDEVLQFNQYIVGWSPKNVENLIKASSQMNDFVLMVKKQPNEL